MCCCFDLKEQGSRQICCRVFLCIPAIVLCMMISYGGIVLATAGTTSGNVVTTNAGLAVIALGIVGFISVPIISRVTWQDDLLLD